MRLAWPVAATGRTGSNGRRAKGLFGAGMFTPVKNLYQVGHWAMYPGGAPSGFMTGRMASLLIRARLKLGFLGR